MAAKRTNEFLSQSMEEHDVSCKRREEMFPTSPDEKRPRIEAEPVIDFEFLDVLRRAGTMTREELSELVGTPNPNQRIHQDTWYRLFVPLPTFDELLHPKGETLFKNRDMEGKDFKASLLQVLKDTEKMNLDDSLCFYGHDDSVAVEEDDLFLKPGWDKAPAPGAIGATKKDQTPITEKRKTIFIPPTVKANVVGGQLAENLIPITAEEIFMPYLPPVPGPAPATEGDGFVNPPGFVTVKAIPPRVEPCLLVKAPTPEPVKLPPPYLMAFPRAAVQNVVAEGPTSSNVTETVTVSPPGASSILKTHIQEGATAATGAIPKRKLAFSPTRTSPLKTHIHEGVTTAATGAIPKRRIVFGPHVHEGVTTAATGAIPKRKMVVTKSPLSTRKASPHLSGPKLSAGKGRRIVAEAVPERPTAKISPLDAFLKSMNKSATKRTSLSGARNQLPSPASGQSTAKDLRQLIHDKLSVSATKRASETRTPTTLVSPHHTPGESHPKMNETYISPPDKTTVSAVVQPPQRPSTLSTSRRSSDASRRTSVRSKPVVIKTPPRGRYLKTPRPTIPPANPRKSLPRSSLTKSPGAALVLPQLQVSGVGGTRISQRVVRETTAPPCGHVLPVTAFQEQPVSPSVAVSLRTPVASTSAAAIPKIQISPSDATFVKIPSPIRQLVKDKLLDLANRSDHSHSQRTHDQQEIVVSQLESSQRREVRATSRPLPKSLTFQSKIPRLTVSPSKIANLKPLQSRTHHLQSASKIPRLMPPQSQVKEQSQPKKPSTQASSQQRSQVSQQKKGQPAKKATGAKLPTTKRK